MPSLVSVPSKFKTGFYIGNETLQNYKILQQITRSTLKYFWEHDYLLLIETFSISRHKLLMFHLKKMNNKRSFSNQECNTTAEKST